MPSLQDVLAGLTHDAAPELVETLDHDSSDSTVSRRPKLRCLACGHQCRIPEGAHRGVQGALREGWTAARAVGLRRRRAVRSDREEAVLPRVSRALAYSFGMLGCDLHCRYCQNWVTSQALRDPVAVSPAADRDT
jgi:pyruvate formate lyase activating enzyme